MGKDYAILVVALIGVEIVWGWSDLALRFVVLLATL